MSESLVAVLDLGSVALLAYWLRSAEALAWGALGRAMLDLCATYALYPVTARFRFDREAARELLGSAKYFLLLAIGSYFTIYGDNAIIGYLLGAQALGYYTVAYRLAQIPFSMITTVANRALFPILSRLYSEPARFRVVVVDTLFAQVALLWPAATGLCLFADVFIPLLYGNGYGPAVLLLRVLFLLTVGRGMVVMIAQALLSSGRFDQVSRVKWTEVGLFLPCVLLGTAAYGVTGAALGAGVAYFAAALLRVGILVRAHGIPASALVRVLGTPALAALAAAAVGLAARPLLNGFPWHAMIAFCVAYGLAVMLLERARVVAVVSLLKSRGR